MCKGGNASQDRKNLEKPGVLSALRFWTEGKIAERAEKAAKTEEARSGDELRSAISVAKTEEFGSPKKLKSLSPSGERRADSLFRIARAASSRDSDMRIAL